MHILVDFGLFELLGDCTAVIHQFVLQYLGSSPVSLGNSQNGNTSFELANSIVLVSVEVSVPAAVHR